MSQKKYSTKHDCVTQKEENESGPVWKWAGPDSGVKLSRQQTRLSTCKFKSECGDALLGAVGAHIESFRYISQVDTVRVPSQTTCITQQHE